MKKRSTLTIISVIMVLFIAKGAAIIEYRFDARESDLQTILDQSGNGFNVKL